MCPGWDTYVFFSCLERNSVQVGHHIFIINYLSLMVRYPFFHYFFPRHPVKMHKHPVPGFWAKGC